jgi:hypothetical protein
VEAVVQTMRSNLENPSDAKTVVIAFYTKREQKEVSSLYTEILVVQFEAR